MSKNYLPFNLSRQKRIDTSTQGRVVVVIPAIELREQPSMRLFHLLHYKLS
jgi:hypothetical protein